MKNERSLKIKAQSLFYNYDAHLRGSNGSNEIIIYAIKKKK